MSSSSSRARRAQRARSSSGGNQAQGTGTSSGGAGATTTSGSAAIASMAGTNPATGGVTTSTSLTSLLSVSTSGSGSGVGGGQLGGRGGSAQSSYASTTGSQSPLTRLLQPPVVLLVHNHMVYAGIAGQVVPKHAIPLFPNGVNRAAGIMRGPYAHASVAAAAHYRALAPIVLDIFHRLGVPILQSNSHSFGTTGQSSGTDAGGETSSVIMTTAAASSSFYHQRTSKERAVIIVYESAGGGFAPSIPWKGGWIRVLQDVGVPACTFVSTLSVTAFALVPPPPPSSLRSLQPQMQQEQQQQREEVLTTSNEQSLLMIEFGATDVQVVAVAEGHVLEYTYQSICTLAQDGSERNGEEKGKGRLGGETGPQTLSERSEWIQSLLSTPDPTQALVTALLLCIQACPRSVRPAVVRNIVVTGHAGSGEISAVDNKENQASGSSTSPLLVYNLPGRITQQLREILESCPPSTRGKRAKAKKTTPTPARESSTDEPHETETKEPSPLQEENDETNEEPKVEGEAGTAKEESETQAPTSAMEETKEGTEELAEVAKAEEKQDEVKGQQTDKSTKVPHYQSRTALPVNLSQLAPLAKHVGVRKHHQEMVHRLVRPELLPWVGASMWASHWFGQDPASDAFQWISLQ